MRQEDTGQLLPQDWRDTQAHRQILESNAYPRRLDMDPPWGSLPGNPELYLMNYWRLSAENFEN